eukprot:CAMPEP_0117527174 /NCGR_PEP_ID=MMETSP0784-20121206/36661_1 /TAXON_ID=39447 /ORGANISM="" /LENGTH=329 /DNA_ID=CAMNT_0005323417 /DNA_START=1 /DNA_END=990 /DNA_ORIENTATION=+
MALAAQGAGDALWCPEWREADGEATIKQRTAVDTPLLFYCSWFCPFAQRAWIALEEKGVPYRYVEINPYEVDPREPGGYTKRPLKLEVKQAKYPDFVASSPRGLVPALNNAGQRVWESLQVIEYVDEKFPSGPSLMPADPHKRAMVRVWAAHCTDRIQKAYYSMLMEQDAAKQIEMREQFFTECRALARAMDPSGPFFLGKDFSMLECAFAPFWQRCIWVGSYYRDLQFPQDVDFERLDRWWTATSTRPSVARTFVCKERLISSYKQYSQNKGTTDYAASIQAGLSAASRANFKMASEATSSLLRGSVLPLAVVALFGAGWLAAKRRAA